jgi:hypothetical protein
VKVRHIAPDISQYLNQSMLRWIGPDRAHSNGCSVHPVDKLIILRIFHHLMSVFTEKRGLGRKDAVLTTRALVTVVNKKNAH